MYIVAVCCASSWKKGGDQVAGRIQSLWQRACSTANRTREVLMEHAYLVTLSAVVAIIAASAMYTGHIREENAEGVQAAAEAPEIQVTATPLPEATLAPLQPASVRLQTGGGTVWPVSGEIIRDFAPDTPVLWATLACFQPHDGVDVSAESGEDVLLMMDGVVSSVTMDELWGWRVQVEQTDGALATYAGLAAVDVEAGQSVTRGQVLGPLGEIPCEAELGAHLHISISRNGGAEDPADVLSRASRP